MTYQWGFMGWKRGAVLKGIFEVCVPLCVQGLPEYGTQKPSPYFSAADLFLFVPTHEAFGLALLEAMAAGLNIISTDVPYGPAEILNNGEFGSLVPLENISDLPDLIYLSFLNCEQIDPNRLSSWLENFDIENIGMQYAEFIGQILGEQC